ncbi:MAG TPA: radical SAM family heme chaperone HemW [Steroidobacteraceae bacterium]|nr:radical SAM family heme chaperone HemW [Steroidobacteraceae bacterium]
MIGKALALYVHMPWCVRKCPYCDFNSHQLKSGQPDASYIDVLIRDFDIEAPRIKDRRVDSVFFGGGTPSLFQPEEFARLLRVLKERVAFAHDAEITLEANPGTIERGRFSGYADAGINRISLGAQSFDARALKVLGRIHSADDTHRAVEEIKAAGIRNFNLDLMYALPGQTLEEALNDVQVACSLTPSHLSYYQLTLEPGTVFHSLPPVLPDEEAAWQIQLAGQSMLADAGFAQYEVSAYAKDGSRCLHNLNYWLFGDYVGIGAGAHGKVSLDLPEKILRTVKPKQPREYQDQMQRATTAIGECAYVARKDLPFEFMLNALRLNDGFDAADYHARTGLKIESLEEKLMRAQGRGLLEPKPSGWRPTELGRRFLNDLQAGFLA